MCCFADIICVSFTLMTSFDLLNNITGSWDIDHQKAWYLCSVECVVFPTLSVSVFTLMTSFDLFNNVIDDLAKFDRNRVRNGLKFTNV